MKIEGWVWFVSGKLWRTHSGNVVVWATRKSAHAGFYGNGDELRRVTVTIEEPKKRGKKR